MPKQGWLVNGMGDIERRLKQSRKTDINRMDSWPCLYDEKIKECAYFDCDRKAPPCGGFTQYRFDSFFGLTRKQRRLLKAALLIAKPFKFHNVNGGMIRDTDVAPMIRKIVKRLVKE